MRSSRKMQIYTSLVAFCFSEVRTGASCESFQIKIIDVGMQVQTLYTATSILTVQQRCKIGIITNDE
uniref:Uncharacterized protein n=1 Tax=Arundo donax TaxID=35708 RepID=A0A0A9G2D0_ARUDO